MGEALIVFMPVLRRDRLVGWVPTRVREVDEERWLKFADELAVTIRQRREARES